MEINPLPQLPEGIKPTFLSNLEEKEFEKLIRSLAGLQKYFHRYLLMGGFPEIALSDDPPFAQRVLREDVVDKVLKRDITVLFGVRNVAKLEKVFLYLCIHSGSIISIDNIAKEIGVARATVANYLNLLETANLIYISQPVEISGKKILKAKPKVYIADAAIRNAVLMLEDVLTDPDEMGIMVETTVYKHLAAFYYRQQTRVGYFRQTNVKEKEVDVVVNYPIGKSAIVTTKRPDDFSILHKGTKVPISEHSLHL